MTAPISATLYAADGTTSVATLTGSLGRSWLDELNATGSARLRLPITDAAVASCTYDQIVKFTYSSAERFAFLVEQMTWGVVDEAGNRFLEIAGRGLLSWLEAALLLPYGGVVTIATPDKRWFNFASVDSLSHNLGVTWATPVGVKWSVRSDGLAGYPVDWPDLNAYWIWSTDPTVTTTAGISNWFRKQFTLSADAVCRLYVTADDFADVYVDGELIFSEAQEFYWKRTGTVDVTLSAGAHVIAIKGGNTPRALSYNPAAMLASLVTLDTYGSPAATILHTDASWQVSTTEPQWLAGDVLFTVFTEAKAFGWGQLANVTVDFTATTDSNGAAWTTTVSRDWDIITTNLLTLASDLCALGIDVWMTSDRVLHAAETRGSTKSVTLTSSSTVAGWKIAGRRATGTYGWVRTDVGWVLVQDSAGVVAHGKIGIGLHAGNTESDATASQVAAAAFVDAAAPIETVTGTSLVPASGATAYVDYGVGDTVTGLSKTGSALAVRLLSLTVTEDEAGIVTYQPEFSL